MTTVPGRFRVSCAVFVALSVAMAARAFADTPANPAGEPSPIAEKIVVAPEARDEQIEARLDSILRATRWFEAPSVRVLDGVAFIAGTADTEAHRAWAGDLARRTQDVVAVVNRIELRTPSVFDFEPAIAGMRELGHGLVSALPLVVFAIVVLVIGWLLSRVAARLTRYALSKRAMAPLLREVLAKVVAAAVIVVGLYIVFRVANLTAVALSIVGGTGLLGLVLGIAFRDITENYLSSVFLSIQPPFRTGDLLSIDGQVGYVERLTNRATVLMSLDGNHVQIPNSKVYKATIRNFTSSSTRREDFTVGIGYDDAISDAQRVAMSVLEGHSAVLADPKPWVLVESLGPATVNLRIYFWLDGNQHSWLKVRSSVIRLVKRAFQQQGISMPDEARELVFPAGVPVHLLPEGVLTPGELAAKRHGQGAGETGDVTTGAEAGLSSESGELREQSRKARSPEEGDDLLARSPETAAFRDRSRGRAS